MDAELLGSPAAGRPTPILRDPASFHRPNRESLRRLPDAISGGRHRLRRRRRRVDTTKETSMCRMVKRLCLAAGLAAAMVWPGTALAASSVTGTVTFDGKVPNLKPLSMDADPACAKMHPKPVPSEMLVLGSGNTMGNILVWVSKGLPEGKTWPPPKTPVVLDQKGCIYVPHVMGIMVGQAYRILNSDGILHNVHALPKINRGFNRPMPATVKESTATFDKPETAPPFQIKCDVHPWMSAYVGVFTHPFFSVTGTDGKFTLSGLDPGTYEITAWHERLGTQTASVTVAASETKTQDFTFTTPAAK
jgi:plastocyanin